MSNNMDFYPSKKNMGHRQKSQQQAQAKCSLYYKNIGNDVLKTVSKNETQKAAEATGDLVGNKTVDKIKKAAIKSTCEDSTKSVQPNIHTKKSVQICISPEK